MPRPKGIPKTGGRKRGAKNKATLAREATELAAIRKANGQPVKKTFLDITEEAMLLAYGIAAKAQAAAAPDKDVLDHLERSVHFGAKLAPYRHEALTKMTMNMPGMPDLDLTRLSDEEWVQFRRLVQKATVPPSRP